MPQSGKVVKLYDEQELLESLVSDTFNLISIARSISSVKKLVEIYEILWTNLNLIRRYKVSDLTFDEVWLDIPTIKHLNYLRSALIVYHQQDFECSQTLRVYNSTFRTFINHVTLRIKNKFND